MSWQTAPCVRYAARLHFETADLQVASVLVSSSQKKTSSEGLSWRSAYSAGHAAWFSCKFSPQYSDQSASSRLARIRATIKALTYVRC